MTDHEMNLLAAKAAGYTLLLDVLHRADQELVSRAWEQLRK